MRNNLKYTPVKLLLYKGFGALQIVVRNPKMGNVLLWIGNSLK